jgi:hypothetical protein
MRMSPNIDLDKTVAFTSIPIRCNTQLVRYLKFGVRRQSQQIMPQKLDNSVPMKTRLVRAVSMRCGYRALGTGPELLYHLVYLLWGYMEKQMNFFSIPHKRYTGFAPIIPVPRTNIVLYPPLSQCDTK